MGMPAIGLVYLSGSRVHDIVAPMINATSAMGNSELISSISKSLS